MQLWSKESVIRNQEIFMKSSKLLLIIMCITLFISGCASNQTINPVCLVAGALIGGTVGGIASDGDSEAIAASAAVVGALFGYLACGTDNDADGDGVVDSKDNCPGTPSGVAVNSSGCPLDSDGDGVVDSQDRCPDSPRGSRVNSSGCALDSDNDGVTDDRDRCPTTPRGAAVNSNGCQLDSDGDGVVDGNDNCPATPRGQAVNEKGCHIIFSLEGVNFATNSAELTQEAVTKLNLAVEMLTENLSTNVRVEGHTDNTGAESYNQDLSQRRAESVVDNLVSRGIDRSRMTPMGMGEGSPVASNDTADGRAQNRRVDFVINN
jgi:OOP family OmpA-OmpF porin